MRALWTLVIWLVVANALGEDIAPGILRTPDAQFSSIQGFPYAPQYQQIGDLRIHYIDVGAADGETVLLLHGEPTWSYLFRKMIPVFLQAGYRVVAPDLVGFGRSDKFSDEQAYSYQMQVDVMNRFVKRLDLQEVTFFGQDWGGLIGLRVVADAPERFARVVVSNTGLPAATGLQGWVGYTLFKFAIWQQGALSLDDLREQLTFQRWVAYSYHVPDLPIDSVMSFMGADETVQAAYLAPFPEQKYKAGAQIMPYLVPSQLRENETAWAVFEAWDKPFLVAFTDSDPVTAGGERMFLQRVPTAQNVTIKGARHFVQEDAGQALAILMTQFMGNEALPAEIDASYRGRK